MARDPYRYFRIEARELADQLGSSVLELERTGDAAVVARLLRLAHTLKGAARVVRLPVIADQAHGIENLLTGFREGLAAVPGEQIGEVLRHLDIISTQLTGLTPQEPAVAIDSILPRPDVILDDAGELDALLDQIADTGSELRALETLARDANTALGLADDLGKTLHAGTTPRDPRREQFGDLQKRVGNLERGLVRMRERTSRSWRHLHDAAERLRLVPARSLLAATERAARDSAKALGREIAFSTTGGEIRLDAAIIRVVQDALVQLVRNAVAHGVEPAAGRSAAGKPPAGRIAVTVMRSGRRIIFRCEDDGRGIDVAALRQAAIRQGRPEAEIDRLASQGLAQLLMNGRVSTAPVLSEVAGRAIGMDIVRDAVEQLGARLDVSTEPGKFTRLEISAPLTLSSVEAVRVDVSGLEVCLPLHAVRQTQRVAPSEVHRSAAGEAIVRRRQVGSSGLAGPAVRTGRRPAARRRAICRHHRGAERPRRAERRRASSAPRAWCCARCLRWPLCRP